MLSSTLGNRSDLVMVIRRPDPATVGSAGHHANPDWIPGVSDVNRLAERDHEHAAHEAWRIQPLAGFGFTIVGSLRCSDYRSIGPNRPIAFMAAARVMMSRSLVRGFSACSASGLPASARASITIRRTCGSGSATIQEWIGNRPATLARQESWK